MSVIVWYFGDASLSSAVVGLVGALIGGAITGFWSWKVSRDGLDAAEKVARDTRLAAEQAWVRDSRREIYDRFLAASQRLLGVMEAAAATPKVPEDLRPAVDEAYWALFETYPSVQTVADLHVVAAARETVYLLQGLKDILDGPERKDFDVIAAAVRDARHDTIDAMRADLRLKGSAKPEEGKSYKDAVADRLAARLPPAAGEEPPPSVVP